MHVAALFNRQIFRDDKGDQNSVFEHGNQYPEMVTLVAIRRTMNEKVQFRRMSSTWLWVLLTCHIISVGQEKSDLHAK